MAGKKTRTARILSSVGHELKENPPRIVLKTQRKKGKEAANKQRVAILLNKARKRGGHIPKKAA